MSSQTIQFYREFAQRLGINLYEGDEGNTCHAGSVALRNEYRTVITVAEIEQCLHHRKTEGIEEFPRSMDEFWKWVDR